MSPSGSEYPYSSRIIGLYPAWLRADIAVHFARDLAAILAMSAASEAVTYFGILPIRIQYAGFRV
jgi:hypothetical protein